MLFLRIVVRTFVFGMLGLVSGLLLGQTYPNKPIRIFSAEAGGGTDFVARLIAQGLIGSMGQQVIVENRPSGVIPADNVAKSPPDGHTLLVNASSLWLEAFLSKTPYDAVKDFLPITLAVNSPHVIVNSVFAPAKTPMTIINRLNQEIVRWLAQAETQARFFNAGQEVVGSSADDLAATIKSDIARMGKVIKDAGIRAE